MSEFSDEGIQAHIDHLLPELQQSGKSPLEVECAVERAASAWIRNFPAPTCYLEFQVDDRRFWVRRSEEGRVTIGKER